MRILPVTSAILSALLLVASGCGSGASEDPAAASVGVRVDPPSALVQPSGTVAFSATVTGTAATAVTWSVDCGTITQAGLYTAPQANGACRVTATSVAGAVSGSALVNVGAGGWAATCAAEPEPTTNVVYACNCLGGAQAGCTYESNAAARDGTKAHPWATWAEVERAWRALPAGGTLALCKGGVFLADTNDMRGWANANCGPSAPCTLRDYTPSWGGTAKPAVSHTAANAAAIQLYGNLTDYGPNGRGGYRFLNVRIFRPDGGATAAASGTVGLRGIELIHDIELCNVDIDGFGIGLYVEPGGMKTGTTCAPTNWKIRGSRIVNNCMDAMLLSMSNTDIDGNYFDNNGHSLCGSYNLANQSGGTTHTIYLDGGPSGSGCRVENVRVANSEFHRNAPFQGDSTTVQSYVAGTGWVRTGGAWYDQPYPQGSALGVGARNALNVTYENNLIDWTPCHPNMPGTTFVGGNAESPTTAGTDNVTIRRNRVLHCGGKAIGFDSSPHALIEANTIVAAKADGSGLIYVPQGRGLNQTSAVVRNNTIYVTGSGAGGVAIWATDTTSTSGNIVTGNSVTFAGSQGAACFRVSSPSLVAFMDNNQCSGASSYATRDGNTFYSLANWRTLTGFDSNSITPAPSGLFANAPTDLSPAATSPLLGGASTLSTCTVLGVASQPCSSTVAIGTPAWSPQDGGVVRSATPAIGALGR